MRFTKPIRNKIKLGILEHRFGERAFDIQGDYIKAAEQAYTLLFDQGIIMQLTRLPSKWVKRRSSFRVLNEFKKIVEVKKWPSQGWLFNRGFFYDNNTNSEVWVVPSDEAPIMGHPGLDIFEVIDEVEQFKKDWDAAHDRLTGILSSFSTVKSLLAAWPELEPFIPDDAPRASLVVARDQLNRDFGLPI